MCPNLLPLSEKTRNQFFPGFPWFVWSKIDLRSRCWRHTLSWTCPGYFFELVSFLAPKTFKNNVFIEYRSSITFHMPNRGTNLYCFGMDMNPIFRISHRHVLANFSCLFHFRCLRSSKIMFSMILCGLVCAVDETPPSVCIRLNRMSNSGRLLVLRIVFLVLIRGSVHIFLFVFCGCSRCSAVTR